MPVDHVKRGLNAGAVGGLAYGAFVGLVGSPLVAVAERYEAGHDPVSGAVVSGAVTRAVGVMAGIALGLLLGAVVFGIAYYLLEPALPGRRDTKSYLVGAAGFVTLFGAPWVALPPQPPGVEQALPTDVRIGWYVVMMGVGAAACGLSGYAYPRLRSRYPRPIWIVGAGVPFLVVPAVALLGPANPVSGPLPAGFAESFRAVVVLGQLWLWTVVAGAHAWSVRRASPEGSRPTGAPTDERPLSVN